MELFQTIGAACGILVLIAIIIAMIIDFCSSAEELEEEQFSYKNRREFLKELHCNEEHKAFFNKQQK